ncbi:MAG TPA: hypothetical protein VJR70_01045 [Stellaceae bacterium]|nr:hypothetical protein [Stellaceae bacterium]
MSPGASLSQSPPDRRRPRAALLRAAIVALLFGALAVASFAVEHTVTLSSRAPAQPPLANGR